nr:IclR family transcriptional regulator C-terminal domain-containing protein [Bradyrhizobium campsiandrae]
MPIHATSSGRAILAQYTPAERQALYRKISFERYSPTTPMSSDAVEAELRRSAARGYHFSNSDFSKDLVGVALPLPIRQRRLSIVVAGPQVPLPGQGAGDRRDNPTRHFPLCRKSIGRS